MPYGTKQQMLRAYIVRMNHAKASYKEARRVRHNVHKWVWASMMAEARRHYDKACEIRADYDKAQ